MPANLMAKEGFICGLQSLEESSVKVIFTNFFKFLVAYGTVRRLLPWLHILVPFALRSNTVEPTLLD